MKQAFLDGPEEVVITTTTTTTEPGATDGMEKRSKLGKNGKNCTNSKSDHRHGSSTSSRDNKSSNSKRRATNTNTNTSTNTNITRSSSSSQAASAPESAFAWKLYTVLEQATEGKQPQQNRYASSPTPTPTSSSESATVSTPLCESISWHGSRAFAIHNPDLFERLVLPDYFHHTAFADFRAQLALHGFRRIASGNGHHHESGSSSFPSHIYTHDFLIQGTPNLCRLILPVRAYHSKTLSSISRSRSTTTTKRWSSPSAASSKRSKTNKHRRCRSSFEAALANVASVDFDDRLYSLDDLNVEITVNDALEVLAALS